MIASPPSESIARAKSPTAGVHRLPALDDVRAEALEQAPVPVTGGNRDDRHGRRVRDGVQQPLFALLRLLVHVRDLDAFDHADAGPDVERAAGVVRVDVDLERLGVADDEERVAELLELLLDCVAVQPVPFDDERRAVPVLRELRDEPLRH